MRSSASTHNNNNNISEDGDDDADDDADANGIRGSQKSDNNNNNNNDTTKARSRAELVGHATLIVLALLGTALYSTTYSLLQTSTQTHIVAAIEMWATSTHLLSASACYVAQALFGPLPHVARTQTALFLGVACTVSLFAAACVGDDGGAVYCAMYFGGAALPRFAAIGAAAWSWIMYVSSLGSQLDGTIDLGVGLVSAASAALVPWLVAQTLVGSCGDGWRLLLCSSVSVTLSRDGTQSTIQADCGNLDTGLALAGLGVGMLLLAWLGPLLGACVHRANVRAPAHMLVACVLGCSPWVASAVASTGARVPPYTDTFCVVVSCLAASTLLPHVRALFSFSSAASRRAAAAAHGRSHRDSNGPTRANTTARPFVLTRAHIL